MDPTLTVDITCPSCQRPASHQLPQLLDLAVQPARRAALLTEDFFARACPHCAFSVTIPIVMAIHDPQKARIVAFIPEHLASQPGARVRARNLVRTLADQLAENGTIVHEAIVVNDLRALVPGGTPTMPAALAAAAAPPYQERLHRLIEEFGAGQLEQRLFDFPEVAAALRRAVDPREPPPPAAMESALERVRAGDLAPGEVVALAAGGVASSHGVPALVHFENLLLRKLAEALALEVRAASDPHPAGVIDALVLLGGDQLATIRARLLHDVAAQLAQGPSGGPALRAVERALCEECLRILPAGALPDLRAWAERKIGSAWLKDAEEAAQGWGPATATAAEALDSAADGFQRTGKLTEELDVRVLLVSLHNRFPCRERVARSIAHGERALALASERFAPAKLVEVIDALGHLYRWHSPNRAEAVERYATLETLALQILGDDLPAADKAVRHYDAGNALMDTAAGDTPALSARARLHLEAAQKLADESGQRELQSGALAALALWWKRAAGGESAENLEKAIGLYARALELAEPGSEHADATRYNLGNAYLRRKEGDRQDNLARARKLHRNCLDAREKTGKPPALLARSHLALGNVSHEQGLLAAPAQQRALFLDADREYAAGVAALPPGAVPTDWAALLLARARSARAAGGRLGKTAADEPEALLAEVVARLGRDAYPDLIEDAWNERALIALHRRDWEGTARGYAEAQEARELRLAATYSPEGRLTALSAIGPYAGRRAYAMSRLGRHEEALLALESGRARLLAESLALRSLDTDSAPGAEAFRDARARVVRLETATRNAEDPDERARNLPALQVARTDLTAALHTLAPAREPSIDDVLTLPKPGEALVIPLLTPVGALVYVLPPGVRVDDLGRHLVELPGVTSGNIQRLLRGEKDVAVGWLDALALARSSEPAERALFEEGLRAIARESWRLLLEPLLPRLRAAGVHRVLLAPQGGAQLLPIAAAPLLIEELDETASSLHITWVPLARVLTAPASAEGAATTLIVANPTGDLAGSALEAEWVEAAIDGPHRTLPGQAACKTAVLAALAEVRTLHFAGHGHFDWRDPLASFLECADGPLTLFEIQRATAGPGLRMAVLSACESGVAEVAETAEEQVGLATGFLMLGAETVLSTLWPVDDLATALFTRAFYEALRSGPTAADPAAALRAAQHRIASGTAEELGLAAACEELAARTGDATFTSRADEARRSPSARPYRGPYFWAGFVLFELRKREAGAA